MWDSEEESAQLIKYPNHNYRTGLKNLENYVWICAHVSDLHQTTVCFSSYYYINHWFIHILYIFWQKNDETKEYSSAKYQYIT